MSRKLWIVTVVSAAAGVYFAVLCAYGIAAIMLPRHVPKAYAAIFALVMAYFAFSPLYLRLCRTDERLQVRYAMTLSIAESEAGNPMRTTKREIEDQVYELQVRICKAFANPARLRILDLVANRERAVADLQLQLGITKANLSQPLAILKAAGVVATRRNGKQIYCSLAIPEVKQACQLIRGVLRAQIRNGRKLAV